jgi:hypothetical protein
VLIDAGHVLRFSSEASPDALPTAKVDAELTAMIGAFSPPPVRLANPDAAVRLRLIEKDGHPLLMAFNESLKRPVDNELLLPAEQPLRCSPSVTADGGVRQPLSLPPGGTTIIRLESRGRA